MAARRSMRLAVITLLVAGPAAAYQPWSADAELGAGYDNNPRNAEMDDSEAASAVRAGVGGGYETRFTPYTALQLRASLAAEHNLDFDPLSHGRLDTRVRFLWKPSGAFFVPVVATWVSVGARDYGSGIRDSYDYRGGVYLMEQLTTQISLRVEAMAAKRDSASRVFDLDETGFGATVDWALAPWLTAYFGYRRGSGDLVVTARGGEPGPKAYHLLYLAGPATAIEPDDAYPDDDEDGDDSDISDDWLAYRLDATTQAFTLGFNVPLTADLALDLQGQSTEAELDGGYSYGRTQAAATLLLRF